jgi:drug/metabolite transporter (DMT)-like permease
MLCGCLSFAWMGEFATLLGSRQHCDWRLVALARSALVLLFALGLALLAKAPLVFRASGILWMRSLAGSISLVCTFYAFAQLSAPEVLTLTNTFPIWVALLSWPLLRQAPTPAVWLAALCGVAGVLLMHFPHLDRESTFARNLAIPAALIASFASAVAMLGLNRLQGLDARAIVVHFSGVATAGTLLICLFSPEMVWHQALEPLNALLLLGIGLTATIGQLFLTLAFRAGVPARVSVVALTQVVFALGLDLLFGQPGFAPTTLAGIGLVLAPTAWVLVQRSQG